MLNPNTLNEEMKELITCYLTGDIDRVQLDLLSQWMNESEENKVLFNTYKSTWLLLGMTDTKEEFSKDRAWNNLQTNLGFDRDDEEQPYLKRIRFFKKVRTAAVWLFLIGLGSLINHLLSTNDTVTPNFLTEITVPYGTKTIAKLPDGSTVYLNAGSTINYNQDFNKTKRIVHLSGEAYFHVATNKAKPFEVVTPFIIVRATGTKFNVKAYPNEGSITATLVEGKIDIRKATDLKKTNGIELKPKQCFVYYKTEKIAAPGTANPSSTRLPSSNDKDEQLNHFKVLDNVKTELYTSWSEENWVIESESLRTFAPKIERRFNMVIRFEDEEIKNYKFTGTIQKETIEQILQALIITTPMISYEIIKDTICLKLDRNMKQRYERK